MSTRAEKPERLQKFLASHGLGSRREIEGWIRDARLSINGKVAQLGDKVISKDRVTLDGRLLKLYAKQSGQPVRVLMLNKPLGLVCTVRDPEGRPTVYDKLPPLAHGRWIGIGRLDINTTGLLLFTTDGELAHKLMHPSSGLAREYAVRILGKVTNDMLKAVTNGVKLDDGVARFEDVVESTELTEAANRWFHVVVMQGRNRLVRRLWESQGVTVSRLKRVRFGPLSLPASVRLGSFLELDQKQVKALKEAVESD